jgi:hypothetical protein
MAGSMRAARVARRRRPDEPPKVPRELRLIAPRGAIAGTRYPAAQMAALDSERR